MTREEIEARQRNQKLKYAERKREQEELFRRRTKFSMYCGQIFKFIGSGGWFCLIFGVFLLMSLLLLDGVVF